jgi:flagellar biosynthesis regulator FlaF
MFYFCMLNTRVFILAECNTLREYNNANFEKLVEVTNSAVAGRLVQYGQR